jgi:hypothetical protein
MCFAAIMPTRLLRLAFIVLGLLAASSSIGCIGPFAPKPDTFEQSPPHMPKAVGPPKKAAVPSSQPLPVPTTQLPPTTQRDPAGAAALNRVGTGLMQSGDYKDAAQKFISALKVDPYAVQPTGNLATCYAALSKKEWALYMLKRLKQLMPYDQATVTGMLAATQSDPNWTKYQGDDQYQAAVATGQ